MHARGSLCISGSSSSNSSNSSAPSHPAPSSFQRRSMGKGGGVNRVVLILYLFGVKAKIAFVVKHSPLLQKIHLNPVVETNHSRSSCLTAKHVFKPRRIPIGSSFIEVEPHLIKLGLKTRLERFVWHK